MRKDIRMEKVSETSAMRYINSLPGNWIYCKHLNNTDYGGGTEQVVTYTKFKVRCVNTHCETILIYGVEDEDRLVIDKESIASYQMTFIRDELYIQVITGNNMTDIYIKDYLPSIKNRLNDILESNQNIIVTEGKTDWKHLKRALIYLQDQGFYRDFDFNFFEYEDEIQMGEDNLLKVIKYNQLFYSTGIKVFIFDADIEQINRVHAGQVFHDWGNNIYSLIIPIPDFRKNTPLISIENYYTDKEIKTNDEYGRRLYINNEFNSVTGQLIENERIFDVNHGKHKKLPPNHIIDDGIYNVPTEIEICDKNIFEIKQKCENIAMSKNSFANYILNTKQPFDKFCFDNFKLIFNIISKIQKCSQDVHNLAQQKCVKEIEISKGVYIRTFINGLKVLEIYVEETEYTIKMFEKIILCVEIHLQRKPDTFYIMIYEGTKKTTLSMPLHEELLQFLQEKVDKQYNRIEVHLVDKEKNTERIIEILKDDIAGACIERELNKWYAER